MRLGGTSAVRLAAALLAGALALGAASCRRERATAAQCERILDRIVELELGERGFRDAALARRKKVELRARLGPELRRCQGRLIHREALDCIEQAKNTEEIGHRCLR